MIGRNLDLACIALIIILIGGGLLDGFFVYLTEMWPDAVKGGAKACYVFIAHSPGNVVL